MRAVDGRWRTLLRVQRTAATALGHGRSAPQMRVSSVRWDKGRSVGRDRGEDALLLEALAVGATAILGCFET